MPFSFIEKLLKNDNIYIYIYIFGAGERGIKLNSVLERCGIHADAFIDNSKEKQAETVCGKRCIDVETAIKEGGTDAIVLVSPAENNAIFHQLRALKFKNVLDGDEIIQGYYFIPFITDEEDYQNVRPFNFYESPYPDIREIHRKEAEIFDCSKKVLDVEFNVQRQLELLERMKGFDKIPWGKEKRPEYRYYYDNGSFAVGSADILYYMLRILRPNRIIEVGSGFSTAVMLDTNDACFQGGMEIISIEPYADRLKSLLRKTDHIVIHEQFLQEIPLEFFDQLQENDVLFIDSSHVSRIDSDVNYYLFEILPRLSKGVYIHFHDIFYPFIYPKQWVYEGRAYNEMYLLRAFLMNNKRYSIQFFGEMLMREYKNKLPAQWEDIHGSLWIRKDV